ncbi:MAG TPA: nitrous oxide reductase family maturation protein NosD, partial [Rhodospirillales bacterium]|nr:nitrous oxide reductase family maturation protein NosD [Rhodospirillales bacterium]
MPGPFSYRKGGSAAVAAGLAFLQLAAAAADELRVPAGGDALSAALEVARPGDVLVLEPGVHRGPVRIDRTVTLVGEPGAIIDGGGTGSTVTISAPEVVLRDLVIRNSGADLTAQDSGVTVDAEGDGAVIENNRILDNLMGVSLRGPDGAVVRGNLIEGRRYRRVNDRGDDVWIWNSPGSVVEDNDIRWGRDGIFVTTSRDNLFRGNRFRGLRYAVHYMYTNDSRLEGNLSFGNRMGFALMFSTGLEVTGNLAQGDEQRGILLNYVNSSVITGNMVRGGPEKCVFIYNSNKNRFAGNWFEGCTIGIHFTAGSERNEIYGNAFIDNREQVKYVGTRYLEWSRDGRGNYW